MSKIIDVQIEAGESRNITEELTKVGSTIVRIKCERGCCRLYSTTPVDGDGYRVINAGEFLTIDASFGMWAEATGSTEGASLSVDSASETTGSGGVINELAPDLSSKEQFLKAFNNFEGLYESDMIFVDETANGRPFMALSIDQDTPHTTEIMMNCGVNMPCAIEVESAIVNRGDFLTDPMPPDSNDKCQVYVEFFSDSAGLVPVTPTAGLINITYSPLGNIFLAPVNAASIDATKCGTPLASYTPPSIDGRMTKGKATIATAVTGANYAKIGFWRY